MSDESKLDEIDDEAALAAYPSHATELQDVVQGVARLRRWSRFSVLWIVAACLCVFGAIVFTGILSRKEARLRSEALRNEELARSESRRAEELAEKSAAERRRAEAEAEEAEQRRAAAETAYARAEALVLELRRTNELKDECRKAMAQTSELTGRAIRAEKEVAKLRRENDELKRRIDADDGAARY
jgi:membrane-associated HD superfamily phosphohydrolase